MLTQSIKEPTEAMFNSRQWILSSFKKDNVQLTAFMTAEYTQSFSASISVSAEGGRSTTPTFCNTVLEVK